MTVLDPSKIKQGDAIVIIRDKNGNLHSFGGKAIDVKVIRKGIATVGIMDEKDTYEGTTEIGLTINEKI